MEEINTKDLEVLSYLISLDRSKFVTKDKMFIKNTGIKEGEFYLEGISYFANIFYFLKYSKLLINSEWKKSLPHPINVFIINNRKALFKEEYNEYKTLTDDEKTIIRDTFNKYKNLNQEQLLESLNNDIAYKETTILSTIFIDKYKNELNKQYMK